MKRTHLLLIALLLTASIVQSTFGQTRVTAEDATPTSIATECSGPSNNGLILVAADIVASDNSRGSEPERGLTVLDPDGSVQRSFTADDGANFIPLGVGCSVLVDGEESQPRLFNAASGETKPLSIPAEITELRPDSRWLRRGDETRFVLLTDREERLSLLLDTWSGKVSLLESVLGEVQKDDEFRLDVISLALVPDESKLLIATRDQSWIVTTTDPTDARVIPDTVPGRISLSYDGSQVAYLTESADERYEVVIESPDGKNRHTVTEAKRSTILTWVPVSNVEELIVINILGGPGAVRSFVDGKERVFKMDIDWTLGSGMYFSPSGRQLVFAIDNHGVSSRIWLDLDTGQARRLEELDGFRTRDSDVISQRWRWRIYASDDPFLMQIGDVLRVLDVKTGHVADIWTVVDGSAFPGELSNDRARFFLNVVGPSFKNSFQLFDLSRGSAVDYPGYFARVFSPDGRQVLVTAETRGDEREKVEVGVLRQDGQIEPILTLDILANTLHLCSWISS